MSINSSFHKIASEWANAGFPVFPCRPGTKVPATANGFKDATTDAQQIDAWWKENPEYNPAFCPQDVGLGVIDLDPPDGVENWERVAAEHGGVPETFTVKTPRGGFHLYYRGEVAMSVGHGKSKRKIADHVDTRGVGSYVLLPGSRTEDGTYEVTKELDFAPIPAWIAPLVAKREEAVEAADARQDLPAAITRARKLLQDYVARGDVAVSGQTGNSRTYVLACELFNLGLSADKAEELVSEIWNPHCQPPWEQEELHKIIHNGSRYAQNASGAWAVAPASEVYAEALDKLPADMKRERRSRFHAETEDEQELGQDPKWMIGQLIQESSTVLFVGPTQSYKSFLALDIALGVAAGVETFGTVPESGPVFYAALEGKTNIKRARRRAWRIGRGVEGKLENFYVMTAPMIAVMGEMEEFCQEIDRVCAGKRPKLIVLDTLSKAMAGLNENDAGDAGRLIRFCDGLVESFGCSVLVIHHTGKNGSRGSERGSSAFHAGFDTVIDISATRQNKAVEVWVRKHKDAEEREHPWTFEGRVIGPSLVFYPTTQEKHASLTKQEDEFEPAKIGAALRQLKAVGQDRAVATNILASQLAVPVETEAPEDRTARVTQISRKLGALSKTKLAAYCIASGAGNVWFLPDSSVRH